MQSASKRNIHRGGSKFHKQILGPACSYNPELRRPLIIQSGYFSLATCNIAETLEHNFVVLHEVSDANNYLSLAVSWP